MRKFLKPLYALPVTAAICLSAIGFSVSSHMYALNSGQEITVPARGYDPRDLCCDGVRCIRTGHRAHLPRTPDLFRSGPRSGLGMRRRSDPRLSFSGTPKKSKRPRWAAFFVGECDRANNARAHIVTYVEIVYQTLNTYGSNAASK